MIYLKLFINFLKIGACTFGGGYAMLPLIQEQVIMHEWLTKEELINFIAVSESTPGPFSINISTYVGMEKGGLSGAFCATFGVVLPSFVIILIIIKCFDYFQENKIIKGCMTGLKPSTVGLISATVISTGKTVFFQNGISLSSFLTLDFFISAIIFGGMLIIVFKKIHPIFIIVLSGVLGITAGYLFK